LYKEFKELDLSEAQHVIVKFRTGKTVGCLRGCFAHVECTPNIELNLIDTRKVPGCLVAACHRIWNELSPWLRRIVDKKIGKFEMSSIEVNRKCFERR
jgi:hypothetical protein